jgi:hypothetical protein
MRQVNPRDSREQAQNGQTGCLQIRRYGRFWAVYDASNILIVVTLYKKGAVKVVRRLERLAPRES